MITELAAQAVALENEIMELNCVLAAELARAHDLTREIKAMETDLRERWDAYEAQYAWAFGPRGLYPEIPVRWYPVVFRFIERLDAALNDEQKAEFQLTQVKEKFGGLRIYYTGDWQADSIIEPLIEQAESEVEHIETVHKRLQ